MVIDLHGLREQEAVMRILNALYAFRNDDDIEEIVFITGKGNVLRLVLEQTLAGEGYHIAPDFNNGGSYTLRKRFSRGR